MKQAITEEMGVHKDWYKNLDELKTLEDLTKFMKDLGENYEHDYGTIVYALTASAVAAARVFDELYGGITGFQAGCVMWQFIREFNHLKGPMRLLQFEDMLYPQYARKFADKKISKETWEYLQAEANKMIAEKTNTQVSPSVYAHWISIKDGQIPFGYEIEEDDL